MVKHKRIAWLILIVMAAASVSLIIATRQGRGEASVQPPQRITMKVLRRHDQLHVKLTAKEIQDNQPPPEERSLEDQIPKNVPIKIKIRKEKEKAFKDSKSDKWARDFELEVKNTGTKPIYYLVLILNLPELRIGQGNLIFDLRFGERKFANFAEGAKPEDLSLKPGETMVLKIKDGNDLDWQDFSRGMFWPRPIRFELKFQELSFGDGTGFRSGGRVWPPLDKNPGVGACLQIPDKHESNAHHARKLSKTNDETASKFSLGGEPASFLPAIFSSARFYSARFASSLEPSPVPDSCCSADGCQYVHEYEDYDACYDGGCSPTHRADPRYCFEQGTCLTVEIQYRRCHVVEDGYNYWYPCGYALTNPCSAPIPTPTPTPTPTPASTPVPCPLTAPGNCASGIARDYCTNLAEEDPLGVQQGCPIFFHAEGFCCVRDACAAPTPTPPPCNGALFWQGHPLCSWSCSGGAGDEGGGGGSQCTPYYWVWFQSDDGGATWYETSETYCCCL